MGSGGVSDLLMYMDHRQYWAAGTGYGHSGAAGEKWDVEAYLAAQAEQDRLKEDLLRVRVDGFPIQPARRADGRCG